MKQTLAQVKAPLTPALVLLSLVCMANLSKILKPLAIDLVKGLLLSWVFMLLLFLYVALNSEFKPFRYMGF